MKPLIFMEALYCVDSRFRPLRGFSATERGCASIAVAIEALPGAAPGAVPGLRPGAPPVGAVVSAEPRSPARSRLRRLPRPPPLPAGARRDRARLRIAEAPQPLQHGVRLHHEPAEPFGAVRLADDRVVLPELGRVHVVAQPADAELRAVHPAGSPAAQDRRVPVLVGRPVHLHGPPKSTYSAWRLPLFLPVSSTTRGHTLEVWGCVRPATYAFADTGQPQKAEIQFAAEGQQLLHRAAHGHGHAQLLLRRATSSSPSSGTVRLAWQYPAADPLLGTSRRRRRLVRRAATEPATPIRCWAAPRTGDVVDSRTVQVTIK